MSEVAQVFDAALPFIAGGIVTGLFTVVGVYANGEVERRARVREAKMRTYERLAGYLSRRLVATSAMVKYENGAFQSGDVGATGEAILSTLVASPRAIEKVRQYDQGLASLQIKLGNAQLDVLPLMKEREGQQRTFELAQERFRAASEQIESLLRNRDARNPYMGYLQQAQSEANASLSSATQRIAELDAQIAPLQLDMLGQLIDGVRALEGAGQEVTMALRSDVQVAGSEDEVRRALQAGAVDVIGELEQYRDRLREVVNAAVVSSRSS